MDNVHIWELSIWFHFNVAQLINVSFIFKSRIVLFLVVTVSSVDSVISDCIHCF